MEYIISHDQSSNRQDNPVRRRSSRMAVEDRMEMERLLDGLLDLSDLDSLEEKITFALLVYEEERFNLSNGTRSQFRNREIELIQGLLRSMKAPSEGMKTPGKAVSMT